MTGIGILGGTFDPVHIGHLQSAWDVQAYLGLSAIEFMPNASPVHRASASAKAEDRLAMLRLATVSEPSWSVNDCELKRGGPSFTIDSLLQLRASLGEEVPIWLLLGSDAFEGFLSWHRWQDILQQAHLAVMVRAAKRPAGCVRTQALLNREMQACRNESHGRVELVPVTALDVSATVIRQSIANHRPAKFLLLPSVLDYIEQHGLYKD